MKKCPYCGSEIRNGKCLSCGCGYKGKYIFSKLKNGIVEIIIEDLIIGVIIVLIAFIFSR